MVFQSYAIWPHMTVRENVDFPLALRRARQGDGAQGARTHRRSRTRTGAAGAVRRPAGATVVRRPAAARIAGTGAGPEAFAAPAGRAFVQPRRAPAREHAKGDPVDRHRRGHHRRLRHARPEGSALDVRPDRRPQGRARSSRSARRWTSTTGRRTASSPSSWARRTSSTPKSGRSRPGPGGRRSQLGAMRMKRIPGWRGAQAPGQRLNVVLKQEDLRIVAPDQCAPEDNYFSCRWYARSSWATGSRCCARSGQDDLDLHQRPPMAARRPRRLCLLPAAGSTTSRWG